MSRLASGPAILLIAAVALAILPSCGRRGDPVRPETGATIAPEATEPAPEETPEESG